MLIDNDTHQRETLSERPIRPPLRGNHSTQIRQRCDNILQWRIKFIGKVTVQNLLCTKGLSLNLVVLFSTNIEIETVFSFISIIKVTTVCDGRYLEKPINIVLYCVCYWLCVANSFVDREMIAYLKIKKSSKVKSKSFVIWSASRCNHEVINRLIVINNFMV